jgi:hypothetical protein
MIESCNGKLVCGKRVHRMFAPWGYAITLCSWNIADYMTESDEPVDCPMCLKKLNGEHRNCVSVKGLFDEKGYLLPEYRSTNAPAKSK